MNTLEAANVRSLELFRSYYMPPDELLEDIVYVIVARHLTINCMKKARSVERAKLPHIR
jgi:hypothetical protein